MRDCIKRIVETSNGAIDKDTAREMLDSVDRVVKRKVREGFDADDATREVIKARITETTRNVAKEKANIARNILKRESGLTRLSDMKEAGLSVTDALKAEFEGVASPVDGAMDSLSAAVTGVERRYLARFTGKLLKEDLLELFNSGTLNDEIGEALWSLSVKEQPKVSKEAARIAQIIFENQDGMRLRKNAAGADIENLQGYILHQHHDVLNMMKMGREEWVNFMEPLLDKTRSFAGEYDDFRAALDSTYKAITTGVRFDSPLDTPPKLFQFSGPANLAKKLSRSRKLIFKDYQSWKTWNDKLGIRALNEAIYSSIQNDARDIALLERYGTNPEAMMKEITDGFKQKYRDDIGGELGVNKLTESLIRHHMGYNDIPENPKLYNTWANVRLYQGVTKLGSAFLSQLTDPLFKTLEYKFQGKTWLEAQVQPLLDIGYAFKSNQEKAEWASLTSVGLEHIIGQVYGRWSAPDALRSGAQKVQRNFFKLNLQTYWDNAARGAMGRVMAHDLGLKSHLKFSALDPDTKRLFGNYRITEADWDAMRASATTGPDGRLYIFQDSIENDKLAEKLTGYFMDRTSAGQLLPGEKEQRLVSFGTQRGTPIGEAVRTVMQFKSFPTTVITKVWGRALYGKGKADVPAMIYLAMMGMVMGYMVGALKDLSKNRTPKDPRKLETAFAALAQGGGMGVLGDILLQDASFGRNLSSIMAGPTVGTMDDLFKIYSAGVRGGGSAAQAARFGTSLIPGNNLFYVRPIIEQGMLLHMQEDLNPGYIRRMEKNMNKTYGQKILFK